LYVCHRYMLNVYGSYDPEVRLVPYNKVGLDLIVKAHNEYLRILELALHSRMFTHIKVKSHEYSIYALQSASWLGRSRQNSAHRLTFVKALFQSSQGQGTVGMRMEVLRGTVLG